MIMHTIPCNIIIAQLAQITPATPDAGNEALLVWVFSLFGMALALAALELFIPSHGLLGVGAFLCAMAGVGVAFKIGPGYGLSAVAFTVVSTPTMIWVWIKVVPNTPVGKRIILTAGSTPEELQQREIAKHEEARAITALVGARGIAMTALRPGGTVRIEGEDIEAFAETGMIEADEKVQVVNIRGRQVKVRKI